MAVAEALSVLEDIELRKKEKIITTDTLVIGCARLGSDDAVIKNFPLEKIKEHDFGKAPHCLIIPGKMHFQEEEMINLYRAI